MAAAMVDQVRIAARQEAALAAEEFTRVEPARSPATSPR